MQKKIILLLMILLLYILTGCKSDTIERDLQDGKCNTCGGKWHYLKTHSGFNDEAYYFYKCDNCNKEVYTKKWYGKD